MQKSDCLLDSKHSQDDGYNKNVIRNKTCYKCFFPQVNYNGKDRISSEADKMADARG